MRILALLVVVAMVYLLIRRVHPTPPVETTPARRVESPSAPGSSESNLLKRPLDLTHEALDANKKRTSEEF